MHKFKVFGGIAAVALGGLFLAEGVRMLSVNVSAYMLCLEQTPAGSHWRCAVNTEYVDLFLIAAAIFLGGIWLLVHGLRETSLKSSRSALVASFGLIAISVFFLAKGVMEELQYLQCIELCPLGFCGSGVGPPHVCDMPIDRFVVFAITTAAGILIILSARSSFAAAKTNARL